MQPTFYFAYNSCRSQLQRTSDKRWHRDVTSDLERGYISIYRNFTVAHLLHVACNKLSHMSRPSLADTTPALQYAAAHTSLRIKGYS